MNKVTHYQWQRETVCACKKKYRSSCKKSYSREYKRAKLSLVLTYLNLDGVRHGGDYLCADFTDRVDNGKPDDVNRHHDAQHQHDQPTHDTNASLCEREKEKENRC